jgi:hypothetical protein
MTTPVLGSKSYGTEIAKGQYVPSQSVMLDPIGDPVQRIANAAPYGYDERAQAQGVSTAQRDLIAYAEDAIIANIGAQNIKLFLPMNEGCGMKLRDPLNRSTSFTAFGAQWADGLLGNAMFFNGNAKASYLLQDAVTENSYANTGVVLTATGKLATRIKELSSAIAFARLGLRRTGTLAAATVQVAIHEDDEGEPAAAAITNGTSVALEASEISATADEKRGFVFATPPVLSSAKTYWLVLSYETATGVDGDNYVAWKCGSNHNYYGEALAIYTDAWAVTADENFQFGLWNDDLVLDGDYSIIAVVSKDTGALSKGVVTAAGLKVISESSISAGFTYSGSGWLQARAIDTTLRNAAVHHIKTNTFDVIGMTFNKAEATGKLNAYVNGRLKATVDGTAETANTRFAQPLTIGGSILCSGATGEFFDGKISHVIITGTELTAAVMGTVTQQLTSLRHYGQER